MKVTFRDRGTTTVRIVAFVVRDYHPAKYAQARWKARKLPAIALRYRFEVMTSLLAISRIIVAGLRHHASVRGRTALGEGSV